VNIVNNILNIIKNALRGSVKMNRLHKRENRAIRKNILNNNLFEWKFFTIDIYAIL